MRASHCNSSVEKRTMPSLDTALHRNMLAGSYARGETNEQTLYGMQWGDPNEVPFLRFVRDQYIAPYLNFDHVALEIGPGGGRWTRYLLSFRKVIVVDYHRELLDELAKNFAVSHLTPIQNSG